MNCTESEYLSGQNRLAIVEAMSSFVPMFDGASLKKGAETMELDLQSRGIPTHPLFRDLGIFR